MTDRRVNANYLHSRSDILHPSAAGSRQSHYLHLMQNDLHGLITADPTAAFRHGTVRYRFRNRICHRLLQDQHRNIVSRQSLRHLFKSGSAYRKIRLLFLQRFQKLLRHRKCGHCIFFRLAFHQVCDKSVPVFPVCITDCHRNFIQWHTPRLQ